MGEIFNLTPSPDDGSRDQKQKDEKKHTRRALLRKVTTIGGGLAGAGVVGEVLRRTMNSDAKKAVARTREKAEEEQDEMDATPPEIFEDPKEYKSGDIFFVKDPFIKNEEDRSGKEEKRETRMFAVCVMGWKVMIDKLSLYRFAVERGFTIDTETAHGFMFHAKNKDNLIFPMASSMPNAETDMGRTAFTYTISSQNGGKFEMAATYILPSLKDPVIVLQADIVERNERTIARQIETGKRGPVKRRSVKRMIFKIRLSVYTPLSAPKEERPRIGSESPLRADAFEQLNTLHGAFSKFKKNLPDIYIMGPAAIEEECDKQAESAIEAHYDQTFQHVVVPTREFTDPEYRDEGYHAACHELAHHLREATSGKKEIPAWHDLEKAYQALSERSHSRYELERNECMRTLREATYDVALHEGVDPSRAGHPWDNENEMFASVVTVLRYFGQEFLTRYRKLTEANKKDVRGAVGASIRLLASMNPDHVALQELIPHSTDITHELGL